MCELVNAVATVCLISLDNNTQQNHNFQGFLRTKLDLTRSSNIMCYWYGIFTMFSII